MNPAEAARLKNQQHQHPSRELRRGSLDGHVRSRSEGTARRYRKRHTTRQSSTESSATSLDVRCACQYFQGDTLFPTEKPGEPLTVRNNLFTEKKVVFKIRYVTIIVAVLNFWTTLYTLSKWDKQESGFCALVVFLSLWTQVYLRMYVCDISINTFRIFWQSLQMSDLQSEPLKNKQ